MCARTMELKVFFILSFITIVQCKLLGLTCKQIRSFVDGHNSRRLLIAQGKVGNQPAASEMNMVMWDDELYVKAAKWVVKNRNHHNPERTIPSGRFTTGENLYWYSTTNLKYEFDEDNALHSWFSEHSNYTYGPLQAKDFSADKKYDIGHYTQMVWSDSIFIGCAISQNFKSGWNKYTVICNYGPGGNYLNEKPYKTSGAASGKLSCATRDCSHPYGNKCKKN